MKFYVLAIVLILIFPALADPAPKKKSVADTVMGVLNKKCVDKKGTAVRVVDTATGEVVYDWNGSRPLSPASVMKLVTTGSALRYLGPSYRFRTYFLYDGKRKGSVIEGDLIIKGGGDPKLVPEEIWRISQEIKRMGIRKVTGSLILDGSFFDGNGKAPKWKNKRSQRAYDAKLGALSVNFNTIAVHVYPSDEVGGGLIAALEPETENITLQVKGKTINRGKAKLLVKRVNSGGKRKIVVSGKMRARRGGVTHYVNMDDPIGFAGDVFRTAFKVAGLSIEMGTKEGKVPSSAKLLYVHKSEPLSVTLRDLNRYSSNFVAEQIVKTIAAEETGKPGTHENGLKLSMKFLRETGVSMDGIILLDGSGLSRGNRLTATSITDLLVEMEERFDMGPDYIASLGIMGVDGSVKKRLKRSPARSKARAKTGTLTRVSSLAGYVSSEERRLYSYAIILTNNKCYYSGADELEDKIIDAIYRHKAEK